MSAYFFTVFPWQKCDGQVELKIIYNSDKIDISSIYSIKLTFSIFQNIKDAPEEFPLLLRKKCSTEAKNTLFNKQKKV